MVATALSDAAPNGSRAGKLPGQQRGNGLGAGVGSDTSLGRAPSPSVMSTMSWPPFPNHRVQWGIRTKDKR